MTLSHPAPITPPRRAPIPVVTTGPTTPFTNIDLVMPPMLTTGDVATLMRCPESTVRYWRHIGSGPQGVRVGRRVLYRREVVEAWLAAREAAERPAAS